MRNGLSTLSVLSLLTMVAGEAHAANSTNFDLLTLGATYQPPGSTSPSSFVASGVVAATYVYISSTGVVFSNVAIVDDLKKAFGAGLEMHLSNVELKFGLTPTATLCTLKYGYYGGESSLRINGSARVYGEVFAFNGTTPGGATIKVSKTVVGSRFYGGEITMSGSISNFAIGGQELWIDDLSCVPPGPPVPASTLRIRLLLGALLLAVGLAVARTARRVAAYKHR